LFDGHVDWQDARRMRPAVTDGVRAEEARARRLARLFPGVAPRPPSPWRRRLLPVLVLLPTLLAALYYGVLADDRYVSEARFLIRSGTQQGGGMGGMAALMQLAGLSRAQDDAYAVRDFLTSRDALRELDARVGLRRIYAGAGVDLLLRYPSPLWPANMEGLYRYFQHRLEVVVNIDSGLVTLRADAPTAAAAQRVAATLLDLGEGLVNRLNARMRADTIRVAADEVRRAEELRIDAEVALTAFRNRELMLDPTKTSAMVLQVIGRLAAAEAETRAEIAALRVSAPTSPQLPPLEERAVALARQIAAEQARVGRSSDGLADKIAAYERLVLDQDFATRLLAQAMTALEGARVQAQRQEMFLERVVDPGLPDAATEPRRIAMVLTVFGFNVLGAGLLWLLGTGLREHAAGQLMRARAR
jgi:capsular polysaccharide transport system permease protein